MVVQSAETLRPRQSGTLFEGVCSPAYRNYGHNHITLLAKGPP
jgi:hypothetical protein